MFRISLIFSLVLSCSLTACKKDDVDESPAPIGDNDLKKIYEFKFNEEEGLETSEEQTGSPLVISADEDKVNRMQGVENRAIFFDGFSTMARGNLSEIPAEDGFINFSLWVAVKSFPLEQASIFAIKSEDSDSGFDLSIDKFGGLEFRYFINGRQQSRAVSNEKLSRNNWQHLFLSLNVDTGEIELHLDGNTIANSIPTTSISSWPESEVEVFLANFPAEVSEFASENHFSGSVDVFNIYSGQPSEEDIAGIASEFTSSEQVNFNTSFVSAAEDSNRPTYHPIPDYGWTNEPNGLMYYNNEYHMFYQKNDVFLGIAQQNWGHMKSSDLVKWEDLNSVLWPEDNSYDNYGTWAGSSAINDEGDPVIMYTGVDGVKATMAIATSFDGMQSFEKYENNPLIEAAPDEVNLDFRDPFIWKEASTWHMIVGSGIGNQGGNVVHYTSDDLYDWEDSYQGILFQGAIDENEGEFWEVPIMHEFDNGKYLFLVQKTPDNSGPARTFYWIGDFDGNEFVPDHEEAKNFEIINGFLSPTVTRDENNITSAIGIIPDEVHPALQEEAGWAHLFSLPQQWELSSSNNLIIKPHPNLENYRGEQTIFNNLSIKESSDDLLEGASGRHIEIETSIQVGSASRVGFELAKSGDGREKTLLYLDVENNEWVIDASSSSLDERARLDIRTGHFEIAPNETVDLRIFIDGSVLEVFVNNKEHFTGRFFPTLPDATGLEIFAEGGQATAESIIIWEMNSEI